jgi:hypothetical protein
MRKESYEGREWDENGIPRKEKLISLGLQEAAKKISRVPLTGEYFPWNLRSL